ncbi:MAG TPA: glycosyltransferase family 1 protein [Bryobacteraceae bacterium]|jgi:glycosyltransferase involved in cell wall biosynthesis|nr:glycosyltransferase family 1 protein [Bryobacteraceae bacterium]
MKIGVNALYLLPGAVGGTEIYLRQLLRAMAREDRENEYLIFTNRETGSDLVPESPRLRHCPQNVTAANRPARILYEQFRLPKILSRERVDVLFNPGFTAPCLTRVPMVTVFHDLQHVRHPEYFKRTDLPFWHLLLRQSAIRSQRLIAVSEATRNDILEHYADVPPEHVVAIHHGVEDEFFHLERHVDEVSPYLLCVSTLHPHKNIERLLRVFHRIRKHSPRLRLVLAGMRGFHTAPIEKLVQSLQLTDAVAIPGWIAREDLYRLYAGATIFIYPSTFEGFGMPVLEAMAAQVPVACSAIPPLQEIAGDAALFFDPISESQMQAAIERLLDEPATAEAIGARGNTHARRFTWENAAQKTIEVLKSVAACRQKSHY